MLDFGQLQADIVKNIVKMKQKGRKADYKVFAPEWIGATEYVPVAYKEVIIFLIPRDEYLLDPGLWKRGLKHVDEIFKLTGEETEELTDTGIVKQYDSKMLKVFADKEGELIFVDTKLLRPFGKDNLFRKSRNRAVVYVVNAFGIAGLVCAVRVKKSADYLIGADRELPDRTKPKIYKSDF